MIEPDPIPQRTATRVTNELFSNAMAQELKIIADDDNLMRYLIERI